MCISTNIADPVPGCFDALPVPNIEPVGGYTLLTFDEPDNDGFPSARYIARCAGCEVYLDVHPARFTPSQDRFAWLVQHDFPVRPHPAAGWDDTDIEMRLAIAEISRIAA